GPIGSEPDTLPPGEALCRGGHLKETVETSRTAPGPRWLRWERHSRSGEKLPGLDRVPVETHFLEPLDRLIDHPIVLARETKGTKSERLEVRPRPQESRRLLLDLRASLERDERVEPRDETFDVPKSANQRAP